MDLLNKGTLDSHLETTSVLAAAENHWQVSVRTTPSQISNIIYAFEVDDESSMSI